MYRVVFNYFVLTETHSWRQKGILRTTQPPKSVVQEPPSTSEMSARDAEDMVDSMLRDSPLPDAERSEEGLPEGDGSGKLPEEEGGEKLPKGGNVKLPEDTLTGKLIKPCTDRVLSVLLII